MLNHTEITHPASYRAELLCKKLREADSLIAEVIGLIQQGGTETITGLPIEMLLSLEGRLTSRDARFLAQAAETLSHLPITMSWFQKGVLSWGQVRAMLCRLSGKPLSFLSTIDPKIGSHAEQLATSDPDYLVSMVDEECFAVEAQDPAKEERAIRKSFLAIQQKFDGGSRITAELDPESTAIFIQATDAKAAQPRHPDARGETRAEQRAQAVIHICEQSLSGSEHGRPKPRLLATFDVNNPNSVQLLTGLVGAKPRLSKVALDTMLCDATIIPVGFDGDRVVVVGNEQKTTTRRVRRGLEARDKGCRFPGCNAPVSWTDAHHPTHEGTTCDEQYLLCRRCHNRIHREGWKDVMHPDGTISFTRRGKKFVSPPP
ncbi:MAG: HNH endonuclease signature motif containing protein [Actinomycetota bacterium]